MAKTPTRKTTKPSTRKTKTTTTSRRSTASSQPRRARASTPKTTKPEPKPRAPISAQQRVDIAGIVLIAVGLVLLLSLLTAASGSLTGWITQSLTEAIGWGAYLLPITFLVVGLWFLMSKMENFPTVSTERVLGILLLFFNLVAWFQLFGSATANNGGRIGRFFVDAISQALGKPGMVIILVAWLLTALILLVDLSMSDLTFWLAERFKHSRSKFAESLSAQAERRKAQAEATQAVTPASPTEPPVQTVRPTAPEPTPVMLPTEPTAQPAWVLPEAEQILNPIPEAVMDEEIDEDRARVIEETLKSFSTPGHVVEIRRGPTITMFGVEPDFVESRTGKTRVRVGNIVRLQDDLALALKAARIRIQAPVPGKGYVGVEVPNQQVSTVSLLEVVESPAFANKKAPLRIALGKDVSGQAFTTDLASMPHLLIAGTTGSGKSVCVNAILAGYLLTLTPDQLRIVLVDPKRVELTGYNGIPHLLAPVIVDAEKVVGALQWMLREMDLRYQTFNQNKTRNIDEYNTLMRTSGGKPLPYLLVVIDELADLMMLAPDETERSLTRLAQLARATGIHLILATQRPSTDILTGLIKANFPARIAFAVASGVDSRVILDQPGAERLLGRGDMLFQAPDAPAPVRLQGTYVSDNEINRLTDFWRAQSGGESAPERPDTVVFAPKPTLPLRQDSLWEEMQKDPDEDPISREAILLIRKEGRASVSMLQRKLRIGYTRASRLMEKLEETGIVGAPDPQTGTREVLDWGDYPPLKDVEEG